MHTDSTLSPGQARNGFPALLGLVLGSALQLQQIDLFAWQIYMVFVLLAFVGYTFAASKTIAIDKRMGLALEGRDLRVTGVVASLPQRSEAGLCFCFQTESSTLDGQSAGCGSQTLRGTA